MKFTLDSYSQLMQRILSRGYTFADYFDYKKYQKPCILRHDVDFDIQIAEQFARFEHDSCVEGIRSTYFILLTSDFYNVFSNENCMALTNIMKMGHQIGLHFDEQKYKKELEDCANEDEKMELVQSAILKEMSLLSNMIGFEVRVVSMHRPSELILNSDLKIPNVVNSYGQEFFKKFKYVSDSRMHWRENVEECVEKREYSALHILTHPIWYSSEERSMKMHLEELFQKRTIQTYESLHDNFRDLDSVIAKEDILYK